MSTFSFAEFDEFLAAPLPASSSPPLAASSSRSRPSLSVSVPATASGSTSLTASPDNLGESTSFALLGSSLLPGGSASKRYGLVMDPGAGAYCLGLMGSSKFCLRRGGFRGLLCRCSCPQVHACHAHGVFERE